MIVASLLTPGVAAAFPSGGALPPPLILDIPVTFVADVPFDAIGVAVNVTVTAPNADGYVTVYPCGTMPATSNVNYRADQTVPNFVISALSPDGDLCIATSQVTDVIVDLAGYIPFGADLELLPTPVRSLDSRTGVGTSGPIAPSTITPVKVAGINGVPADASLVVLNATAVRPSGPGHLVVFPCGEPLPATSTVNFSGGDIVPNLVVTRVGVNGSVCFESNRSTDIVGDVAAFAPASSTGVTMLANPMRVVDTRVGTGGPQSPVGIGGRTVQIGGIAGVPSTATAALVNLTSLNAANPGYLSARPCGGQPSGVSNLNFVAGPNAVANLALVALDGAGRLCLDASQNVDVIVDLSGYTTTSASLVAVAPERIYDTREGIEPRCRRGTRVHDQEVQVVNTLTGATVVSVPGLTLERLAPQSLMSHDCDDVYAWGSPKGSTGIGTVSALSATATILWQRPEPSFVAGAWDFGLVGVDTSAGTPQRVYDVESDYTWFELPLLQPSSGPMRPLWLPAGVTDDASIFAFSRTTDGSVNSVLRTVVLFDDYGDEIGEWNAPANAQAFRISPLGTYIAYSVFGENRMHVVKAIDGTEIASAPGLYLPTWMSDGAVLYCVGAQVPNGPSYAYRWDLFSPARRLMPGLASDCLDSAA